jgi:hypothetical protein
MITRSIAVIAAFGLSACAAEISTVQLDPGLKPNSEVDGLPYRVKEAYVLELYRKTDKGYVRVNQDQTTVMANPDRLYLLKHDGMPFSDSHTKFEVNADSTLKSVHLDATSGAAKAADTVTQTIGTIEKARAASDAQRETAAGAAETAELSYAKAIGLVRAAEAKLAALPAGATAVDRVAAENALIEAKISANIAARKAGVERPYPDVTY